MLDTLKEYASKKLELLVLEAKEKTVVTAGFIVFASILFLVFLFFILFLNIGIGLLIGYYIGNYAYGILIMAAFYLILLIIILAAKKAIKNKVASFIIKTFNS